MIFSLIVLPPLCVYLIQYFMMQQDILSSFLVVFLFRNTYWQLSLAQKLLFLLSQGLVGCLLSYGEDTTTQTLETKWWLRFKLTIISIFFQKRILFFAILFKSKCLPLTWALNNYTESCYMHILTMLYKTCSSILPITNSPLKVI